MLSCSSNSDRDGGDAIACSEMGRRVGARVRRGGSNAKDCLELRKT